MSMQTDQYPLTSGIASPDERATPEFLRTVAERGAGDVATASAPGRDGAQFPDDNWALDKCGFKKGRDILDARRDPDPGPIAVIDVGYGLLDHPCIQAVVEEGFARRNESSSAVHAAEVSGVIANACPVKKVHVYNVATTAGIDTSLILEALARVASSNARVLNLSIGWHQRSIGWEKQGQRLEDAIDACLDKGIVVVAAMGEYEEPNYVVSYPAAFKRVVAVGATDHHDRRLPGSAVGEHIWIAAPGEDIPTVAADGAFGLQQGTSFATALVSAAAWLAIRARPSWKPDQIRAALGNSADATLVGDCPEDLKALAPANGKWNLGVGCGRLDVAQLATVV